MKLKITKSTIFTLLFTSFSLSLCNLPLTLTTPALTTSEQTATFKKNNNPDFSLSSSPIHNSNIDNSNINNSNSRDNDKGIIDGAIEGAKKGLKITYKVGAYVGMPLGVIMGAIIGGAGGYDLAQGTNAEIKTIATVGLGILGMAIGKVIGGTLGGIIFTVQCAPIAIPAGAIIGAINRA